VKRGEKRIFWTDQVETKVLREGRGPAGEVSLVIPMDRNRAARARKQKKLNGGGPFRRCYSVSMDYKRKDKGSRPRRVVASREKGGVVKNGPPPSPCPEEAVRGGGPLGTTSWSNLWGEGRTDLQQPRKLFLTI